MNKDAAIIPLNHPILRLRAPAARRRVERVFGSWLPAKPTDDLRLSLEPFTKSRPLCYFYRDVIDICLRLFEGNPNDTLRALRSHEGAVTHAILSLLRRGASWGMEEALSLQTPKQIAELERIWHPEYQRYIEHIYNNLITVLLDILGKLDGKDYVGLTLANRIQKLGDKGYPELANGADATIRNAISHGGVRYGHLKITYHSSNQTVELLPTSFTDYLDSLADICSSIMASLLLFVCRDQRTVETVGYQRLPLGIRFLLIRGVTHYSGFILESAADSGAGSTSILNLYCISRTKARMVHRFDGVSVASQAIVYGGGGYDRIAVSIDCGGPVPTYSPYKVKELKDALRPGASRKLLAKILDPRSELLWYDVPALSRKLYALKSSIHAAWSNMKDEVIAQWRQSDLEVLRSRYDLRFNRVHGNKSVERLRRIEAHAVLAANEVPTRELIEKIILHASRRLRRKLLRSKDISGRSTLLARRPKYVWLKVHEADGRLRELETRAVGHPSLLAVSEWIHRSHRTKPILVKNPDKTTRSYRIRFFV